jgi:hypothetical protein
MRTIADHEAQALSAAAARAVAFSEHFSRQQEIVALRRELVRLKCEVCRCKKPELNARAAPTALAA